MSVMRAWWREGRLQFGARPRPRVEAADEVLVRVALTGLCRTDVAVADGRLACNEPCIIGHEVAGVVEAVGSAVRAVRVGDRVALLPRARGARLGIDRDGGFAEAVVVPEAAVARVPAGLPWRHAAFVEPVAACLAVKHAQLAGAVTVIGEGRIATLTRRVLGALGVREAEPVDCDVAIDTGASAESLARAMASVRDGGLVVLKGRPPAAIAFDVSRAVERELRFQAVGWAGFDEAFALLATLEVEDLLGEVHPLEALGDLLALDESQKRFLAPDPEAIRACAA